MEDKLYTKTKYDGIWENNPHLGFLIYTILYLIILFSSIFVVGFLGIPIFIYVIWLIFLTTILIVKTVLTNQTKNMSKSTAFIERDGKLYVIQLLYANKPIDSEVTRNIMYTPSEPILQALTLENNIKVAQDIQTQEQEVKIRRNNPISFIYGLNDVLNYIKENPNDYMVLPNDQRSKLDNLFRYHLENGGMATIVTETAAYNFLILNNPKIIEENNKSFTIRFYNEKNEICDAKFSNCFGKILDNIKEKSNS